MPLFPLIFSNSPVALHALLLPLQVFLKLTSRSVAAAEMVQLTRFYPDYQLTRSLTRQEAWHHWSNLGKTVPTVAFEHVTGESVPLPTKMCLKSTTEYGGFLQMVRSSTAAIKKGISLQSYLLRRFIFKVQGDSSHEVLIADHNAHAHKKEHDRDSGLPFLHSVETKSLLFTDNRFKISSRELSFV